MESKACQHHIRHLKQAVNHCVKHAQREDQKISGPTNTVLRIRSCRCKCLWKTISPLPPLPRNCLSCLTRSPLGLLPSCLSPLTWKFEELNFAGCALLACLCWVWWNCGIKLRAQGFRRQPCSNFWDYKHCFQQVFFLNCSCKNQLQKMLQPPVIYIHVVLGGSLL